MTKSTHEKLRTNKIRIKKMKMNRVIQEGGYNWKGMTKRCYIALQLYKYFIEEWGEDHAGMKAFEAADEFLKAENKHLQKLYNIDPEEVVGIGTSSCISVKPFYNNYLNSDISTEVDYRNQQEDGYLHSAKLDGDFDRLLDSDENMPNMPEAPENERLKEGSESKNTIITEKKDGESKLNKRSKEGTKLFRDS